MQVNRILFFYEKNHLKQPFIKLLMNSLAKECPHAKIFAASFASMRDMREDTSLEFIPLPKFKPGYGASKFSSNLVTCGIGIFSKFRPDVIITFLPLGFLAAQMWSKTHRCRSVYYPFEIYGKQLSKFSRPVIFAEKLGFILGPDAFITQNESRAGYYIKNRFCRAHPCIAHNYKARPETTFSPVDYHGMHGIPEGKKVVLYQGMLSVGRWLDRLALSAKYLRDDAVLVMMGPKQQPWWDENIAPLLSDPGLDGRLFILESVPHEMVSSYAHAAAVGVIIYDDSVLNNIYCEPGKLSDFVHAGVPVIAPDFPSIKLVVEENSLGVMFSDYTSKGIAKAVNDILSLPKSHFDEPLRKAAKFMTWEAQWETLKKAILG